VATRVVVVGVLEALHRVSSPVLDRVGPGWTASEYKNKLEAIHPDRDILFIGDSGVGWGIADAAVTRELRRGIGRADVAAYNLGLPATSVDTILHHIERLATSGGSTWRVYDPLQCVWILLVRKFHPATCTYSADDIA
jgi:hypothetical protein